MMLPNQLNAIDGLLRFLLASPYRLGVPFLCLAVLRVA